MTLQGIDELDRQILHELQHDARGTSSSDIAERVSSSPSPSTVRKCIQRLERQDIIMAYRAAVDYEQVGYQLHVRIVCTAPITDRAMLSDQALDVSGVIGVRELATGERNVVVTIFANDSDDLTRIAVEIGAIGLAVVSEELVRSDVTQLFSEFVSQNLRGE
nr:Lrp/AsnC family transcriptional regulator [Halococcus hamelinensis]